MKNLIYSIRSKFYSYLSDNGIPLHKAILVAYAIDMIITAVITAVITYTYTSSLCK
jgi:hypothetical protein